tara:strand:- start:48 stop:1634 length:1587 start_codon:yes stop_codon:yes gene_type:complete
MTTQQKIQPGICKIGNPESDAANEKSCNDSDTGATDARDACKKVEEKKKKFLEEVGDFITKTNPLLTVAQGIAGFLSSDASSNSEIDNTLITKLKSIVIGAQENTCSQTAGGRFANVIDSCNSDCFNNMTSSDKLSAMENCKVNNISQSITNKVNQTCELSAMSEALTNMKASIDNTAIQEAINEAKGLGASANSEQTSCNNISVSQTACKFLTQNNCCSNLSSTTASNTLLNCGTSTNIIQAINNNVLQSCKAANSSSVSDTLDSTISNKSKQKSDNKATGLSLVEMLAIIAVVALVGGTGGVSFLPKKSANIVAILGIVILIIGVVSIVGFFTFLGQSKREGAAIPDPLLGSTLSVVLQPPKGISGVVDDVGNLLAGEAGDVEPGIDRNITFEDATATMNKNDSVGMDFFSAVSGKPGAKVRGTAVYYSEVNPDTTGNVGGQLLGQLLPDAAKCTGPSGCSDILTEPDCDKSSLGCNFVPDQNCYSVIKKENGTSIALFAGIPLTILGFISVFGGVIKGAFSGKSK